MNLKSLFLTMLGAAAIVSCNNEAIGPDGPDGPNGGGGGESTTATFQLNFTKDAGTYSGSTDLDPTGRESAVADGALFIYKLDGTPEAMAYVAGDTLSPSSPFKGGKITLKCKSGDKLIYLAVNLGGGTHPLVNHEQGSSLISNAVDPDYLGVDWNAQGTYGPEFATDYTDGDSQGHEPLNSAIWSGAAANTVAIETYSSGSPFTIPNNSSADNLIKALTGNGNPANGVLAGDGAVSSYYLMSNWGDASSQPDDAVTGGTTYKSTCKFTLEGGIKAEDSRAGTPSVSNSPTNSLLINIQRAVAKVSVDQIDGGILASAGTGGSSGTFAPDTKWAVGNISTTEYPFQRWDGSIVKSARYDDFKPILPTPDNENWSNKMDNSRFAFTNAAYAAQTLTTHTIVGPSGYIASNGNNQAFSSVTKNYAIVSENNNKETYNHYNTFVVFAGVYTPAQFILSVDAAGNLTYNSAPPVYPTNGFTGPFVALDTMYYVGSLSTAGIFFHGKKALQDYICYNLKIRTEPGPYNAQTDPVVAQWIVDHKAVTGDKQADLQEYWHGYCFYRIWIRDAAAASGANKMLVRRNHAYQISVSEIKGPGIGDPNDIIDPDPETIESGEEADTYVTATINIMKWHVVNQSTPIKLD
jgi:hypothetical protein